MNFSYLEHQAEFAALYTACREAEEFALTKPDISATSARKAMEFIVKYIYAEIEPRPPYGCTVYDMVSDPRFRNQFADPAMMNSIDFIRRAGNAAVHQGSLTAENSMRALEHLHFLTGEFAVGVGLIGDYPAFTKPELNRLREMLGKIHSDNFSLNLLPYLRASGHEDWAVILSKAKKTHIAEFSDLPQELDCEAFWDFLKSFEQSVKADVEGILELLPLTAATQKEWKQRRISAPRAAIDKVECYVAAYIADNQKAFIRAHTYYNQALGDKANAYLWLVHPDLVPETMRDAYVKPDAEAVQTEDEYIPLEDAVKQLIRYFAASNPMKRDLLGRTDWCKMNLGLSTAAISSSRSARGKFSKDAVHMGDRKYFVLLEWNKASLMRLRQMTGEMGEALITMDRMADWGFAIPGSDSERRAKERALKREAVAMAEEAQKIAAEAAKKAAQAAKANSDPEASPREIRAFIESELLLTDSIDLLCSAEWCRLNLGLKHPVLIGYEEGVYLRRKQMDGNYTYSRLQLQYARKTYFILRMKISEFDSLKAVMQRLGLRSQTNFT